MGNLYEQICKLEELSVDEQGLADIFLLVEFCSQTTYITGNMFSFLSKILASHQRELANVSALLMDAYKEEQAKNV